MSRYEALVILILICHLVGYTVISFNNSMNVCVAVQQEEGDSEG